MGECSAIVSTPGLWLSIITGKREMRKRRSGPLRSPYHHPDHRIESQVAEDILLRRHSLLNAALPGLDKQWTRRVFC